MQKTFVNIMAASPGKNTSLVIIDVQKAIDNPRWGARNNPDAEKKIGYLLGHWRELKLPIIHIRHDSVEPTSPYRPGQSEHDFKDEVKPLINEAVFGKTTNNAFIGTDLEEYLAAQQIDHLIICGVLTQHSVDCTARMAASLGYRVSVVSDAAAATEVVDGRGKHWKADDVHQMTLAHLAADYAEIKTVDELFV